MEYRTLLEKTDKHFIHLQVLIKKNKQKQMNYVWENAVVNSTL